RRHARSARRAVSLDALDAAARLARARGRAVLRADGWTFVTAEPSAALLARGRSLVRLDARGRPARRFTGDPLAAIADFLAEHACTTGALAGDPAPRVIGYLAYDLARVVGELHLPGGAAPAGDVADVWLAAYPAVARWAPGAREPELVGEPAWRDALARPAPPALAPSLAGFVHDDDASHHMARRARADDHLAAGELDRLFLARRMVAPIAAPGEPLAVYRALAPLPWHALLDTGASHVIAGGTQRLPAGDLRAHFPAESVTGAPRPRAMQLIDELERVRRGAFAGAFGHFGPTGGALAVTTRAGVITRDELRVYTGAMIEAPDTGREQPDDPEAAELAAWAAALAALGAGRARPPRRPAR
ncbi:MAG TPA: chorismate-binding protein, partial [Kofleriaceae bacterium]|nr:chorismate-binding protein [Kofleriaceae bacterium]